MRIPSDGPNTEKPRAITRRGVHEKVTEIFSDPGWKRGAVLDAGCGEGALALDLAAAGYRVYACDLYSDNFLADRDEIEFRGADLNKFLPYEDDSFDYVVSTEVLEHLENPFQALREFARVIRAGGRLVLTIPNYLNIEMRLRFLLTGSLSTPKVNREDIEAFRDGLVPGHIMPMTWWVLKLALEASHFKVERIEKNQKKRKQIFLRPLVTLIRLWVWLGGRKMHEKWILDETNQKKLILGGNTLIVVAGRVPS